MLAADSALHEEILLAAYDGWGCAGVRGWSRELGHVLAAPGEEASRIFSGKAADKFDRVAWEPSRRAGGAPILTDVVLAYAECRVVQTVTAGDHRIIVGEVEGSAVFPREPLLYGKGEYHAWPVVPVAVGTGAGG